MLLNEALKLLEKSGYMVQKNKYNFIPRKVKPISLKDRLKYASIEHSAVLDYLKDK